MLETFPCFALIVAFEIPPTLFKLTSLLRLRSAIFFAFSVSCFFCALRSARTLAAASFLEVLMSSSASSSSSSLSSELSSESSSDSEDDRSGLCCRCNVSVCAGAIISFGLSYLNHFVEFSKASSTSHTRTLLLLFIVALRYRCARVNCTVSCIHNP